MEQKVIMCHGHKGYALVTVLFITGIGLLFGAGALLCFRHQCQLRIERQHEVEKVYSVRSAMNNIVTANIAEKGDAFTFHTASDRNLNLIIKPVDPIFPNATNEHHFSMTEQHFTKSPGRCGYDDWYDYEYGATDEVTNSPMSRINLKENDSCPYGMEYFDTNTIRGAKCWLNIGMRGTGGWLQEEYGRRYSFWPRNYASGKVEHDTMRLCIIRSVTNTTVGVGQRHGWPLSMKGEMALVFELKPISGTNEGKTGDTKAMLTLYEYAHTGAVVEKSALLTWSPCPAFCNMGLQIADRTVTLFYISNEGQENLSSRGITFTNSVDMTTAAYSYFHDKVVLSNGETYAGVTTNAVTGRVEAPELRAVFEIEACADKRRSSDKEPTTLTGGDSDTMTKFVVTPAYQYDIFLEHPFSVTNRATAAQKSGEYIKRNRSYPTVLTYDTHGTEHRGFRYDERHAGENRQ